MDYKILVADDEESIVGPVRSRLELEGFLVSTASDGEEALRMFAQEKPDILLLDLVMPKKNGFEVLKEVREKFKDKWRPVIIVTTMNDLETTKKCYRMEADHYLTKPCSLDQVVKAVQTMVSLIPHRNAKHRDSHGL